VCILCNVHADGLSSSRVATLEASFRPHHGHPCPTIKCCISQRKRNYAGQNIWARGYFVSTVGRDEATIREYIRNQDKEDLRLDQMNVWK